MAEDLTQYKTLNVEFFTIGIFGVSLTFLCRITKPV